MTARPKCVHCGKVYGQRQTTTEKVRWDTPLKDTGVKSSYINPGQSIMMAVEPTAPPPPYRGNGIVIKEGGAYLSADDHRMVMLRYVWDGESWYGGYPPFCTLRCALDYAREAYNKKGRHHAHDPSRGRQD